MNGIAGDGDDLASFERPIRILFKEKLQHMKGPGTGNGKLYN